MEYVKPEARIWKIGSKDSSVTSVGEQEVGVPILQWFWYIDVHSGICKNVFTR
jgi:hypothetical protein